jgi:haloalkane dehalogenase
MPRRLVDGMDPLDPFTGQLSPAQGPYAVTMHGHYWAFYLMAENLRAETCVLEHPTVAEFENELRRGYDYLGLQLNWNTLCEAAEMIERARAIAPRTKIILGGYALPQVLDPLPPDRDVAATIVRNADFLCREEGVAFMRRLVEDLPSDRPITQLTLPCSGSHLAALGPAARVMRSHPILVALGCPAGCDFCNTSAFFHRRKVQVASPAEVASFMAHHARADGEPFTQFELFDEDLFWEPEFSRTLGRHLRAEPATCGRVGYFTFGSVRTLSRFDPEELVANGLDMVWIGVESTLEEVLQPSAHLGKRKGRAVGALFGDLRDAGIQVVGSLILGFDFHTADNVGRDVDAFVALDPAISQVTPLVPCAGTALYARLKKAGRIDPRFGWTVSGGFRSYPPLAPAHLTWDDLEARIDDANRRLYLETGPSGLKTLDTALRGHLRFRDASDPVLRARAQIQGEAARRQYPILEALRAHPPSARLAERTREVAARWREAFGEPDELLVGLGRAFADRIGEWLSSPPEPAGLQHPPMRRTCYRPGAAPEVRKRAA